MSFDWRIVQKWSRHGWKQVSLDPSHKRVAVSQVEPHQLKPRYAFPDEPKGLLARFVGPGREALRQTILPVGYPQSVHPNFLPFNTWNFVQSISGSANGVLATQCLLVGLGLGAPSSSSTLAIAATLNWVLKDGLGQLGGILFVARFGGNFDKEAKRYRFLASLLMSLSSSLEMLIPAIPSLFLPVASLANVCKNIAWMALSATRAQIHRNFTRIDNMGDLTGKAASWNTAASLLGTGLGVLLSSVFLISASAATEIGPTDLVLRCCLLSVPLTAFYLWASYRCSAMAVSPRLTLQRLDLIMRSCLPSVMTSTGEADTSVLSQLSRYIINPTSASKKERFLYFPWDAHKLSLVVVNPDAALIPECLPHDQFKAAKEFLQRHGFLALPATYPASKINIWFAETETDAELVIGILTAYIAEAYFKDLPWMGRLGKAHEQAIVLADSLLTALESRGWNLCESLDLNQRPLVLSQDKID